MRWTVLFLGVCAVLASPVWATTLTGTLTADDNFTAYVSTDDSTPGTWVAEGSTDPCSWKEPSTFTYDLTPGVTHYLHVVAWDVYGYRAAFLGEFSLSDNAFQFQNGTQSLLTGSAGWAMSSDGFGIAYYLPDEIGVNTADTYPWYTVIPGISPAAQWIWSHGGYDLTIRYFSAPIVPSTCTLTVSSGIGGSVTTPGVGAFSYDAGTVVSVVALASMGYHFEAWTGTAVTAGKVADPGSASTTVTLDGSYTLQANFASSSTMPVLTVSSSADGSVTTPGEGSFPYPAGTVVAVVATPDPSAHFVNWTGTAVTAGKVANPSSASTTVTVDASYTLRANFCGERLTLTVTATNGGVVWQPGVGTFTYPYGTIVTLEADPDFGYVWAGWSGSLSSSSALDFLTITASDMKVRANFTSLRDVLYVDDDAPADPGPHDNTISDPLEDGSPQHPFDCIQEAIDVAAPGARVIVREGTYWERIDFLGKAITVTGFDPSAMQPHSYPVIDGAGVGPVVRITALGLGTSGSTGCGCGSPSASDGMNAQPVLTGFVITGGDGEINYGSAIAVSGLNPLISHCVIAGNRTLQARSGAIYCENSNLSLVNCTVTGNIAGEHGAALLGIKSSPVVVNSIFWGNVPAEFAFDAASQPLVTYVDVQGGWNGTGNIDSDPLFVLSGYWADPRNLTQAVAPYVKDAVWVPGDCHLVSKAGHWDSAHKTWVKDSATSPCVDAGEPDSPVLDEPTPNGNRVNLGAYGGTSQASKSGQVVQASQTPQ